MESSELEGKVCVVTGGGSGIGAATAERMAGAGGRALLDLDADAAERTADALRARGADARAYAMDVTGEDQVAATARAVAADFGGVDVLVNNAGLSPMGASMTFTLDEWGLGIDVLLTDEGYTDLSGCLERTPLRRTAEPAEIAEAIVFLASERASFVTGHTLVADGGWTSFAWWNWSGDPDAPELPR